MSSQFPEPWRPISGSYEQTEASPRWQYNERDFGRTVATTAMMQPFILATSGGLEQIATVLEPQQFGSVRDLAVWLWSNAVKAAWLTFEELFLGWMPTSWRFWSGWKWPARRRRDPRPDQLPDDDGDGSMIWNRCRSFRHLGCVGIANQAKAGIRPSESGKGFQGILGFTGCDSWSIGSASDRYPNLT